MSTYQRKQDICACKQYTCYQNRLRSFAEYPKKSFMDPRNLAYYGFWYSGTEDLVYCHDCNAKIGGWEPSDCALLEHTRISPSCRFILKFKPCNEKLIVNKIFSEDFIDCKTQVIDHK